MDNAPFRPVKMPHVGVFPMGYSSMTRTSFWGMGARGGPEVTGVHALGPEGEEQAVIRLVMRQKAGLKKGAYGCPAVNNRQAAQKCNGKLRCRHERFGP